MQFFTVVKITKLFLCLKTYAVRICGSSRLKGMESWQKLTSTLQTSPVRHPAHAVWVEEYLYLPGFWLNDLHDVLLFKSPQSINCLGADYWQNSCRAFLSGLLWAPSMCTSPKWAPLLVFFSVTIEIRFTHSMIHAFKVFSSFEYIHKFVYPS